MISQHLVCKFHDHHGHYFLHFVSSFTHSHSLSPNMQKKPFVSYLVAFQLIFIIYLVSFSWAWACACMYTCLYAYIILNFQVMLHVAKNNESVCGTIINLAMHKEGKFKLKSHVTLPSRKWWVTGMPNSPTLASKNCCDVRIFVKVIVYFCFRITSFQDKGCCKVSRFRFSMWVLRSQNNGKVHD